MRKSDPTNLYSALEPIYEVYVHYDYSTNVCTDTTEKCKFYSIIKHNLFKEIGCSIAKCPSGSSSWREDLVCHMGEGKKYINGTTSSNGRTFELHSNAVSSGHYSGRPFCEDCPSTHPYCEAMLCTNQ